MATTATPAKSKPKTKTTSGAKPEVVARREVQSTAKWVRISPRKARLVADHIRGRSVPEARTVLAFSDRAAAIEIDKVLRSAVANAEANHGMFGDDLVISAAYVDVGPTIKRWRARARGRVARIHKPTCHITVKLAEDPRIERAAPPPKTEAKPKRAPRKQAEPKAEKTETKQKAEAKPKAKPQRKPATKKKETTS